MVNDWFDRSVHDKWQNKDEEDFLIVHRNSMEVKNNVQTAANEALVHFNEQAMPNTRERALLFFIHLFF